MIRVLQRGWWAFLSMCFGSTLNRLVDVTGIIVFVGANGSGKSMAAVRYLEELLEGIEYVCGEVEHRHQAATLAHAEGCRWCTPPSEAVLCDHGARIVDEAEFEDHVPVCSVCEYGQPWALCPVGEELQRLNSHGVRLVYSTVQLLDRHGRPHRLYRRVTDYRQLLTIEHSDVLLDEVAGVSDSTDSASMPVQVTNWLHKLRKADVRLRVTTPAYSRCSKPIRQACQVVIECRGFFAERGVVGRLWRPNRAMLYKAYDAREFDDFTRTTGKRIKPMARSAFWRPGSWAETAYNSWGAVGELAERADYGMCLTCGGSKAKPKCGCDEGSHLIPLDELVVTTEARGASRVRVARRRPTSTAAPVSSIETTAQTEGPDLASARPLTITGDVAPSWLQRQR